MFDGVSTSYCCAKFRADTRQGFPVSYFRESEGKWVEHKALPLKDPNDPWRVVRDLEELKAGATLEVGLSPEQTPRQGVNTCGANSVFIFDQKPLHLPEQFLYPLATKELWRQQTVLPHKWILLPYHQQTGRPLTWCQIEQFPALRDYLQNVHGVLPGAKRRAASGCPEERELVGITRYRSLCIRTFQSNLGGIRERPVQPNCVEQCNRTDVARQPVHARVYSVLD